MFNEDLIAVQNQHRMHILASDEAGDNAFSAEAYEYDGSPEDDYTEGVL